MLTLFHHFIQLFLESAPWLILGFIIAGLIKAFIPEAWMLKHLGGNTPITVIKAALIGAPLPLCSCGVIPAALGLRRAGASKASTTAFLISTPETGVDSISITYAFMGWFMALVRPMAAISSAITAGLLVLWLDEKEQAKQGSGCATKQETSQTSCCAIEQEETEIAPATSCCVTEKQETSCCETQEAEAKNIEPKAQSWLDKVADGWRFSFLDLSKDIALWLLIGLILAAMIRTFIPVEWLTQWSGGWVAFLVMALIGVPMYICATASTPIAAAFLFSGVSPGAVLVFMLVGPATNIATMSLVKQELGFKTLLVYLSSILSVSFLFAWLVNLATKDYDLISLPEHVHEHAMNYSSLSIISGVILSVLLVRGLWLRFKPN